LDLENQPGRAVRVHEYTSPGMILYREVVDWKRRASGGRSITIAREDIIYSPGRYDLTLLWSVMADIFIICLPHVEYFQMEVDNTNTMRKKG
jgi:hypothetical protein